MGDPQRVAAKDVQVERRHTAVCRLPGCGWAGHALTTYQEANGERQEHIALHQRARDAAVRHG